MHRWLRVRKENRNAVLVEFCDASGKGYTACVYMRTCDTEKAPSIILVIAKTKIESLTKRTFPKLEDLSILLLKWLMNQVKQNLAPIVGIQQLNLLNLVHLKIEET